MASLPDLANEFLYPDPENHIVYRAERRQVARLVRGESGPERLALPEGFNWVLAPDPAGVFDRPFVQQLPERALEPHEVRVAVEAAGLNFWDVFRSLGFIEEGLLGREMCGHIVEVGEDVSNVSVGDHVVGMGFGAFGPDMITHEELVAEGPGRVLHNRAGDDPERVRVGSALLRVLGAGGRRTRAGSRGGRRRGSGSHPACAGRRG